MNLLIPRLRAFVALLGLMLLGSAHATQVYDDWTSNDPLTGNYILTITHDSNRFLYNLTVDPWNAEALGVFIDLGNLAVGASGFQNLNPAAPMSLYATDSASSSCGSGCNLNGLSLPALGGGDWELIFRLGGTGFDGIQTFSWATGDFGLDESALGLVAIRAQQLCSGDQTLPAYSQSCTGSDKAYGYGAPQQVPEPAGIALLALALIALARLRQPCRAR